MRVRTGRFVELRSRGEPGPAQAVKVADGKGRVEEECGVVPPASSVDCHLCGADVRESTPSKFPVDDASPFPMLEVDGS
jgi:hypothetical protein